MVFHDIQCGVVMRWSVFYKFPSKHPIARVVGCIALVETLIYIQPRLLSLCMQYPSVLIFHYIPQGIGIPLYQQNFDGAKIYRNSIYHVSIRLFSFQSLSRWIYSYHCIQYDNLVSYELKDDSQWLPICQTSIRLAILSPRHHEPIFQTSLMPARLQFSHI